MGSLSHPDTCPTSASHCFLPLKQAYPCPITWVPFTSAAQPDDVLATWGSSRNEDSAVSTPAKPRVGPTEECHSSGPWRVPVPVDQTCCSLSLSSCISLSSLQQGPVLNSSKFLTAVTATPETGVSTVMVPRDPNGSVDTRF